jgi:hypothetical protein
VPCANYKSRTTANNIIIRIGQQGQGQPRDESSFEYDDQDQGQPSGENNTIKTESNRVYKGSVSPPTADVSSYQYKPF